MTDPQATSKPRVSIKAPRVRHETPNSGGTYARVGGKLVPADASGQPITEPVAEAAADTAAEDSSAPRRRGKPAVDAETQE